MLLKNENGFTLLEVLVALTLMLVAFSTILLIQSGSREGTIKSRELNTIAMLAKNKLIETELELEGKSFSEVAKEKDGQFEEPYQDYKWKYEIKEIKFPNLFQPPDSILTSASSDAEPPSEAEAAIAGNPLAKRMSEMVTKYLSDSLREVKITISYERGKGTQEYSFGYYWVDLTKEMQIQ